MSPLFLRWQEENIHSAAINIQAAYKRANKANDYYSEETFQDIQMIWRQQ